MVFVLIPGAQAALLAHMNAPYFEAAAGAAFKGIEVALVALRLYTKQAHLDVAERAEKQGFDGRFRARAPLCKWANIIHDIWTFFDS